MTRCIFRKPKGQRNLQQALSVVLVMLTAAVTLELQGHAEMPKTGLNDGSPIRSVNSR